MASPARRPSPRSPPARGPPPSRKAISPPARRGARAGGGGGGRGGAARASPAPQRLKRKAKHRGAVEERRRVIAPLHDDDESDDDDEEEAEDDEYRVSRDREEKEKEEEVLFDRMAEDESAQRSRKPAHDKQPLECNPISSIFIFEFNLFEKSKNIFLARSSSLSATMSSLNSSLEYRDAVADDLAPYDEPDLQQYTHHSSDAMTDDLLPYFRPVHAYKRTRQTQSLTSSGVSICLLGFVFVLIDSWK